MPEITTKPSIHKVNAVQAKPQDVTTAVGVNKFFAGVNSGSVNGIYLTGLQGRVMRNIYADSFYGPTPTNDFLSHPAVCQQTGGPVAYGNFPAKVRNYFMLPDGFKTLYMDMDVGWNKPEGWVRVYMRSTFGAIELIFEGTPDRIATNALAYPAPVGATAHDFQAIGRHFVQYEIPLPVSLYPPAGKTEVRYIDVIFSQYRPTDNIPQGVFSMNLWASMG